MQPVGLVSQLAPLFYLSGELLASHFVKLVAVLRF